jgi:crotonobetainyl-CoA:carnitine CoA-transferase CaiB-like acyl-CoA transferase
MEANGEASGQRVYPLEGIHVLEMSHVQAGPTCAVLLADMGAEVVKVESFAGDQFRYSMDGVNFANFNRNKRGIALNLKTGEAKEIAYKLVEKSDVFIENFLPGAMDRLGFGYETLEKMNPRIIYCSISGFGQSGPFRERPAYEPVLQAMSGIMDSTGDPDGLPVRIRPAMIDFCTGTNAAFGITSALIAREKTGRGQKIDVALLDVAIYAMSPYVTRYKQTGEVPERGGSAMPTAAPHQNFKTRDGLVYVGAGPDQAWRNLCEALGLEEMGKSPEYATRKQRAEHREEISRAVANVTKNYTSRELEEKLLSHDVACGRVRNVGDIIQESHVQMRGNLEEIDHPTMGRITTVKTPLFLSGEPAKTRLRAPLLGEHTSEILQELGYGEEQIREFLDKGAVLQYGE